MTTLRPSAIAQGTPSNVEGRGGEATTFAFRYGGQAVRPARRSLGAGGCLNVS